ELRIGDLDLRGNGVESFGKKVRRELHGAVEAEVSWIVESKTLHSQQQGDIAICRPAPILPAAKRLRRTWNERRTVDDKERSSIDPDVARIREMPVKLVQ